MHPYLSPLLSREREKWIEPESILVMIKGGKITPISS
jgi:hypothetical protein